MSTTKHYETRRYGFETRQPPHTPSFTRAGPLGSCAAARSGQGAYRSRVKLWVFECERALRITSRGRPAKRKGAIRAPKVGVSGQSRVAILGHL